MKLQLPDFPSKLQLLNYLQKNMDRLIALKKSELKRADAVEFDIVPILADKEGAVIKASVPIDPNIEMMKVTSVINTTNLIDTHQDLHIPKMWNKSLKETTYHMLLQEHKSTFEGIIADGDDVDAFVQSYSWKELGAKFDGDTEGLTFRSNVMKERNSFMFNQYAKKRVRNHSVGMRYGKLVMCIGNKDFGAEFEAWEKYLPLAVNPELAEDKGYFWAVPEGKVVEGSAVPRGSNWITPTLDKGHVLSRETTEETGEPRKALIDYDYMLKNLSL